MFENDTSTIAAEGRLVVRHTAAALEVDILANGSAAFTSVPNGAVGQVDLAEGTISAEVSAGATEPVVIGPADLPITEGASLIVYAVDRRRWQLTVLTQSISGLGSTPSVAVTGNSSVVGGSNNTAVIVLGAVALLALASSAPAESPSSRAEPCTQPVP